MSAKVTEVPVAPRSQRCEVHGAQTQPPQYKSPRYVTMATRHMTLGVTRVLTAIGTGHPNWRVAALGQEMGNGQWRM